jgi:hypothetical protein
MVRGTLVSRTGGSELVCIAGEKAAVCGCPSLAFSTGGEVEVLDDGAAVA